ncbi:MAG: hypothetical protein HYT41_02825 [Candidatus Sungbacteria bacterium]|nr:hypothetical protein [Candidatus Sungbacteria bacterium]
MSVHTKQERDERYERLPQVLKEALFSADIAEKMFALGKKYGLTMEKIGFMSEEAGFVVLGLTPPRAFTAALAERLGIPADAAEKIALEISHEIFFPLREALKQTHQIDVGEGAVVSEESRSKRQELGKPVATSPTPVPQPVPAPVPSPMPQASKSIPTPPTPASPPPPQTPKPILPSPTILSSEVKPAPMPASPPKPEPAKTQDAPVAQKPATNPEKVRVIAEHLEKEIAPIISTIRNGGPAGFLSREETEKLVAEKQAEETGIKKQESRIMGGGNAPISTLIKPLESILSSPPPIPPIEEIKIAPPPLPQQKNSIDLRGSAHPSAAPPPPPLPPPTNPKIPHIDLRAAPIRPPTETKEPPQASAPVPEKTKPYQGYDPYREPIE